MADTKQREIPEALQQVLEIIVRVADPDKVILFGSRARGESDEDSDYDLLVLKSGVEHSRRLARKIYRNFENIKNDVDVLVYDSAKYEKAKVYPYKIYHSIHNEGKVVYEK